MEAFRVKENAPGREEHCQKSGAGRFLTLTGGNAFPTKSLGAPNDHPNSIEGGDLRMRVKSNMRDWRNVVPPPQLGISLFDGAFIF